MRYLALFAISISIAFGADFTTYIGGANPSPYLATSSALAADANGDTYVTGNNAAVTKLDPAGDVVFTKTLGPVDTYSYGFAIAVDPAGNIWIAGQTEATNFPVMNALQPSKGASNYGGTGFLAKMAPDGTILYASFFGGMLGESAVNGIATDRSGNVYLTGWTDCSDFTATSGLPASPLTGSTFGPVYGLFAAKLDPMGQKLLYSAVIAGPAPQSFGMPQKTIGQGVAVDEAGDAFIAGTTTDTTRLGRGTLLGGPGAFVFQINAAGNALGYFSYLESALKSTSVALGSHPIAVDASGNVYVAGYTNTSGPGTAFDLELSPAGDPEWTVSFGGPGGSNANAISVDASANVWLTGTTGPVESPGQSFVEQVASVQTVPDSLQFPPGAAGQDVVVDSSGVVHVAGPMGLISAITPAQPLAPRALSIDNAASGNFSGTVAPGEIISIYGFGLGPSGGVAAMPEDGQFPTSLGGVQVLVNGAAIPLLYVSGSQINAEIPTSVASGGLVAPGTADIQVTYNSATLPDFRLAVGASDFAPFEDNGSMAVINQDGTLNKIANPAEPGTVVSFWATGFGIGGPGVNGSVETSASNYCSSCQITLFNGSARVTETVAYAGTSPGLIDGLIQINLLLPVDFTYPAGGAWVTFAAPGFSEQVGWVNVK